MPHSGHRRRSSRSRRIFPSKIVPADPRCHRQDDRHKRQRTSGKNRRIHNLRLPRSACRWQQCHAQELVGEFRNRPGYVLRIAFQRIAIVVCGTQQFRGRSQSAVAIVGDRHRDVEHGFGAMQVVVLPLMILGSVYRYVPAEAKTISGKVI